MCGLRRVGFGGGEEDFDSGEMGVELGRISWGRGQTGDAVTDTQHQNPWRILVNFLSPSTFLGGHFLPGRPVM